MCVRMRSTGVPTCTDDMKQYVAGGTIYGKDTCPTESVKGLAGVESSPESLVRMESKTSVTPRLL